MNARDIEIRQIDKGHLREVRARLQVTATYPVDIRNGHLDEATRAAERAGREAISATVFGPVREKATALLPLIDALDTSASHWQFEHVKALREAIIPLTRAGEELTVIPE